MAKTVVGEKAEMSADEARAFLAKTEAARLERNRKLREWRADPKNGYKEYYAGWLQKRADKVAEAQRIVAEASKPAAK